MGAMGRRWVISDGPEGRMTWQHADGGAIAMVCTGVLVGMGIPVTMGTLVGMGIPVSMGILEGIPVSMGILGGMDIPTDILVSTRSSWLGLAPPPLPLLSEPQQQHPQCRVGHWGMKSLPTGCMSKAPSSAKMLPKMLPSSDAPGLTAVQIPLMITVTF